MPRPAHDRQLARQALQDSFVTHAIASADRGVAFELLENLLDVIAGKPEINPLAVQAVLVAIRAAVKARR